MKMLQIKVSTIDILWGHGPLCNHATILENDPIQSPETLCKTEWHRQTVGGTILLVNAFCRGSLVKMCSETIFMYQYFVVILYHPKLQFLKNISLLLQKSIFFCKI